jgi:hypothetical protein
MMKPAAEEIDVAEIHSPPRVTQRATQWGLKAGWGLDLTTEDSDGKAWGFSKQGMQKRAINKINRDKPLLVTGSPMCTDWSTMIKLNWSKMGPDEKDRRTKVARRHLRFCVKLYQHQANEGRYLLHEHPMGAGSWNEPEVKSMVERAQNILAKIDQCQYGLWINDREGWTETMKPRA